MKHVSLETGGKSPNIVFADAGDLDHVARTSADGVFYNSGQSCNAPTRILVEDSIREEFMALVAKHARPWTPADPLDPKTAMGAVVDRDQMNRVLSYIDAGKAEGARLAAGGQQALSETGGSYIEPTVFDGRDQHHEDRPGRDLRPGRRGHQLQGRGRGHPHRQ